MMREACGEKARNQATKDTRGGKATPVVLLPLQRRSFAVFPEGTGEMELVEKNKVPKGGSLLRNEITAICQKK